MKKKYLFCTKIWTYLTEIPLAFVLYIACYYNFTSDKPWQFLPLIIITAAVMAFIGIYFFRMISVSFSKIRYHGLFSSRDSAIINKDKTLIITLRKKGYIGIHLYGNDGMPALFDGLKGEESVDIYLFRGRAIGGKRTAGSLLKYFGVTDDDVASVLESDSFTAEYGTIRVSCERVEDVKEIRIFFKETV